MAAFSSMTPPFELGTSLKGTDADGNLINTEVLGRVHTFPAYVTITSGVRAPLKTHYGGVLKCVALRNVAGVAVYGKNLVRLKLTAGNPAITSFDGYSGSSLAQKKVVLVDPHLDGSVAANDICWCVLQGPALGKTPRNGEDFGYGDIAVGDDLIANGTIGAGTTSSTTAGKIAGLTYFVGATAGITQNARLHSGILGMALSARTTAETDSDILVQWNINIF